MDRTDECAASVHVFDYKILKRKGIERMNLDTASQGRDNNLDLIRFVAAVMVIFSHAFPIALGEGVPDPLAKLTGQISFGSLAVSIFFVYGGYLIAKSMCRVKTAGAYFKARFARIFPPLIAVTAVLALIVGAVLTSLPAGEYYTSRQTYQYLLNGVLVLQHNLPGVFEHNLYGRAVNGPLWTLPIEFFCYIMCFVLYKCRMLEKKYMPAAAVIFSAGCLAVYAISARIPVFGPMIRPIGLFFAGILYYVYRDKIPLKGWIAWVCLACMVLSAAIGILPVTIFFFFPYFFFYIGFGTKKKVSGFAKHGEISYGMYLCAWPVQQILSQYLSSADGTMNPYVNFLLTVPAAIVLGYAVYRLVERPVMMCLKRGKKVEQAG